MNTTFSFSRLGLLLKRFMLENKQRELIFWGIMICVFSLIHQGDSIEMILYITGFIFAAGQFKQFSYTPGGMQYLLIPATHIEKLTASILLTTVYFFFMTLLTYCIGNIVGTNLQNLIFETTNSVSWDLFYENQMHSIPYGELNSNNQLWDVFTTFAFIQALFTLGSLYFKRNAVGKTMLSIVCLLILFTTIEAILFKLTVGEFSMTNQSFTINVVGSNSMIPQNIKTVVDIASYLTIPFLWLVSYFRLTEKQV